MDLEARADLAAGPCRDGGFGVIPGCEVQLDPARFEFPGFPRVVDAVGPDLPGAFQQGQKSPRAAGWRARRGERSKLIESVSAAPAIQRP